jgi:hypothetical protein
MVNSGATDAQWVGMYESGEIACTGGTSGTLTHGLGVTPYRMQVYLRCKTAEKGYVAGNEVALITPDSTGANDYGVQLYLTGSTTTISYVVGAQGCRVLNATTGVGGQVTDANWRLVIRAWAY